MSEQAETFAANYAILKEVAETLRAQKEPDRALAACTVCNERLTGKAAFGERLPEVLPE